MVVVMYKGGAMQRADEEGQRVLGSTGGSGEGTEEYEHVGKLMANAGKPPHACLPSSPSPR